MNLAPSTLEVFSFCICACYLIIFAPYERRNHFIIRILSGLVLGETFLYFIPRLVSLPSMFFTYLIQFGLVYIIWALVILLCFKVSVKKLIFGCGAALAIEQFCGAVRELCFIAMESGGDFVTFLWQTMAVYVPLITPFAFFYVRYKINLNDEAVKTRISSIISLIVVFFCLIINRFVKWNFEAAPWYWVVGRALYAMVCSLLALFIYYGFSLFNKMKKETTIIQANRKMEEDRYQEWKQFYEMINISLHDIRHALNDSQESNEYAKKMLGYFSSYEHRAMTGNDTMDVLVYEKGNICQKHKINFTHMVEGESLKKMDELDIYSLFSNLLDNSINAVLALEEEKRVISLVVKQFGEGISVHVSNFYDKNQTKESSPLHGYGLKSVSHVLDKYNGTMKSTITDQLYETDIILLPN